MDNEAGNVVHRLRGRGYQPVEVLEQDYVERLSGVRLECGSSDVGLSVRILGMIVPNKLTNAEKLSNGWGNVRFALGGTQGPGGPCRVSDCGEQRFLWGCW